MNKFALAFIFLLSLCGESYSGLDFSPSSSYVSVPNVTQADFTTGNFSLSFWASGINGQNNAVPIERGLYIVGGWYIFMPNGLQQIWLTTQNTGTEQDLVGSITLPTGWNHWAVVRTGTSTGQWYLNGVTIPTSGATQNMASISRDFRLATFGGASNFFNGKLEDVAIYNRALTATEIKSLAQSYLRNTNTTGRILYLPLNEGVSRDAASGSNIILDRSPNGLVGSPTNNPKWDYSSPLNYP